MAGPRWVRFAYPGAMAHLGTSWHIPARASDPRRWVRFVKDHPVAPASGPCHRNERNTAETPVLLNESAKPSTDTRRRCALDALAAQHSATTREGGPQSAKRNFVDRAFYIAAVARRARPPRNASPVRL